MGVTIMEHASKVKQFFKILNWFLSTVAKIIQTLTVPASLLCSSPAFGTQKHADAFNLAHVSHSSKSAILPIASVKSNERKNIFERL